jgi:tyrosyl-tRNA synthetase
VQTYHSAAAAKKTLEEWNARFSEKRLGDAELPEFTPRDGDVITTVVAAYSEAFGITKSRAEARRLIEQGSIQLDGEKIVDAKARTSPQPGQVLRLDKTRAVRIK